MTLAATNRYMNTKPVNWTPSGGSLTAITGIKSVRWNFGISTKKESGDADLFATVSVSDYSDPTIVLKAIDPFAIISTVAGTKGTLAFTVLDAYNQAAVGGGGKTVSMTNAQIQDRDADFPYREYATQDLTFGAISVDGSTSSITVVAL